ncbi:MAG: hypothetical protein QW733_02880 [Desulfurococcaceae archaeon]
MSYVNYNSQGVDWQDVFETLRENIPGFKFRLVGNGSGAVIAHFTNISQENPARASRNFTATLYRSGMVKLWNEAGRLISFREWLNRTSTAFGFSTEGIYLSGFDNNRLLGIEVDVEFDFAKELVEALKVLKGYELPYEVAQKATENRQVFAVASGEGYERLKVYFDEVAVLFDAQILKEEEALQATRQELQNQLNELTPKRRGRPPKQYYIVKNKLEEVEKEFRRIQKAKEENPYRKLKEWLRSQDWLSVFILVILKDEKGIPTKALIRHAEHNGNKHHTLNLVNDKDGYLWGKPHKVFIVEGTVDAIVVYGFTGATVGLIKHTKQLKAEREVILSADPDPAGRKLLKDFVKKHIEDTELMERTIIWELSKDADEELLEFGIDSIARKSSYVYERLFPELLIEELENEVEDLTIIPPCVKKGLKEININALTKPELLILYKLFLKNKLMGSLRILNSYMVIKGFKLDGLKELEDVSFCQSFFSRFCDGGCRFGKGYVIGRSCITDIDKIRGEAYVKITENHNGELKEKVELLKVSQLEGGKLDILKRVEGPVLEAFRNHLSRELEKASQGMTVETAIEELNKVLEYLLTTNRKEVVVLENEILIEDKLFNQYMKALSKQGRRVKQELEKHGVIKRTQRPSIKKGVNYYAISVAYIFDYVKKLMSIEEVQSIAEQDLLSLIPLSVREDAELFENIRRFVHENIESLIERGFAIYFMEDSTGYNFLDKVPEEAVEVVFYIYDKERREWKEGRRGKSITDDLLDDF